VSASSLISIRDLAKVLWPSRHAIAQEWARRLIEALPEYLSPDTQTAARLPELPIRRRRQTDHDGATIALISSRRASTNSRSGDARTSVMSTAYEPSGKPSGHSIG